MILIPKTEELETSKIKQVLYNHLDMLFEKLEQLNKKEEELKKSVKKEDNWFEQYQELKLKIVGKDEQIKELDEKIEQLKLELSKK